MEIKLNTTSLDQALAPTFPGHTSVLQLRPVHIISQECIQRLQRPLSLDLPMAQLSHCQLLGVRISF